MAPLFVRTYQDKEGNAVFTTAVGLFGKDWPLSFHNFLNLICMRNGREQLKLENKSGSTKN